jgi:hypothetical protein
VWNVEPRAVMRTEISKWRTHKDGAYGSPAQGPMSEARAAAEAPGYSEFARE